MPVDFFDGDAVKVEYLKQYSGEAFYAGLSTGSAEAYRVNLQPVPLSAYPTGTRVNFRPHLANAAFATLDVNNLGPKPIQYQGQPISANLLSAQTMVSVIYDGNQWVLSQRPGQGEPIAPWVRPSDWLAMPSVSPSEQKVVGLLAVYDHPSNYVALSASGAYTVDWGDGSPPQNVASGVKAERNLNWSDAAPSSLTSRGYRQVLITVTPQPGQNLHAFSLQQRHSGLPNTNNPVNWLDLTLSLPVLGVPTIGGATVALTQLERCRWLSRASGASNLSYLFRDCQRLEALEIPANTAANNCTGVFFQCSRLTSVPPLDTSLASNFSYMYYGCSALREVGSINTNSATNMVSMFGNCRRLRAAPPLNTAAVTNVVGMFSGCDDLITVPHYNFGSVTLANGLFQNCVNLETIPALNFSGCTNLESLFVSCYKLRELPPLNFSSATNLQSAFQNCFLLRKIDIVTSSALTNMVNSFFLCSNLAEIPNLVTSQVTNLGGAFYGCYQLRQLPTSSLAQVTNTSQAFSSMGALRSLVPNGITVGFSLSNSLLNQAALVAVFQALGTANGSQSLTITGNPGASSLTPAELAIATNKGWTVIN